MKRIMIADHDSMMYQEMAQTLEKYYTVSPLLPDTDLKEYLNNNQVDLFLFTIVASDPDSIKSYDNIMRTPEMTGKPVIFLVDQSNPELEQWAIAIGVHDIITLPITPELLLHRINNCLELISLRTERPYMEKYQDAISFSFAELVEYRDLVTGGHLKNTERYFDLLLQQVMASRHYKDVIPPEDARDLLRSVKLHDIGKIGINDDVLHKESTLDFNEFEHMKTHTILAKEAFEKIIRETGGANWLNLARDMAYCHHERWDGTGYPNGLKGEEIPLYARMLTVVDVYDALTSNRAYKKAFSHEKSMEIIKEGRGTIFDPDLIDLFIESNELFARLLGTKCNLELLEKE